jgi:anti-sigma B factor antagonist
MKVARKSEGKHAVVLALSGSIQGGPDAEVFHSAIRQLVEEGRRNVLLDLQNVKLINSTGLGILISGHSTIKRAGGVMKIVNLTERVESLFAMTKLNLVFDVYADEVEALRSFRPDPDSAPADLGAAPGGS